MKTILVSIIMLTLFVFGVSDTSLTEAERKMAVEELTKSQDLVLNTVDGLSEAQLNFKPSPESWSVAEIVEHLAKSEKLIFKNLQGAVEKPADASKRSEVKMKDEEVLGMITDRSSKIKTTEPLEPSGEFGSFKETLQVFTTKREKHIEYVKTTEDDLRNHYLQMPFGSIDGLQGLLFMSGHTERHVKQMEELIAHESFPVE